MPNQYKNKVVYGNTVLIDITDTTAVASDVASGKYFYAANGQKTLGTASSAGAISVIETQDSHGGTVVTITGEEVTLQSKTATPSTSSQTIQPDSGYTGLSQVTVNAIPSNYIVPSGTKTINQNGTGIDVTQYAAVDVSVTASVNLQSKSATPSESSQTISPDSGYDGLSSVTVGAISSTYVGSEVPTQAAKTVTPSESEQTAVAANTYTTGIVKVGAISSTYVGSGINRMSSSDLSVVGNTVKAPAGYYASQAQASVSTTTHPDPSVSVNSSTGLITASHTQTAGYVSAGTTTKTSQLSTQAAATITPTKSSQTAVAAGKYTLGAVTVAAIPAAYQDVSTVNATASDVVSGKKIVNSSGTEVTGTLVIQHYYTGSSAPSASTGVDGDIYLKTS